MYVFRKSIPPVTVILPGLGSLGSCADAGAARPIASTSAMPDNP